MISIYVIAFNRPDLLTLQADAFRRHLKDPHRIVVINNGQGKLCDEIDNAARRLGLDVHRVRRPNHTTPNYSHARALEFAYEHVLANGGLSLLLDHDVFPYRPLSPRELLGGAAMAGVGQSRAHADGRLIHYLHPGVLLLDLEAMPQPETLSLWPDRVEGVACDVGGHLWEYWLEHPDLRVRFLKFAFADVDGEDCQAEIVGDRLIHYRGASNWDKRSTEHHARKTRWLLSALAESQAVQHCSGSSQDDDGPVIVGTLTAQSEVQRDSSHAAERQPEIQVCDKRLRILHAVEFYAPSRGGAQEVVRRVSERLAEQGHHVTVATSALPERATYSLNGVRIEEFDISGNAVRGMRGAMYDYQRYLIERPFDVIMTYAAQQWTTDLLLDVSQEISAPVVCAPCGYSALHDPSYGHYFKTLPDKLRRLAGTVYHSGSYQDIEFARSHGIGNLHVIPNGAAASEFERLDDRDAAEIRQRYDVKGRLILAVGSHTGMKGHRQTIAAFAMAPIGPGTLIVNGDARPGAGCTDSCRRLTRVLHGFLRAQGKRVLLTDLPRKELVAAYHAADVLMLLSGCECSPVVLYEAAASGTPFISTDVGNAPEIASNTKAGVILPRGPRPFWSAARELTRLLRDNERTRAMAAAGREAWLQSFTWEQIADSYLALYQSLVGQEGRSAAS